jgi:biopolymer transport protein ExbD
MKKSRRAKRMDRHHQRNRARASLHLVSLMDIFTILVFFLLVNSGEVQVLPNTKALKLPESMAQKKPAETLVVMVNHDEILVQGHPVVNLLQPLPASNIIQPLKAELLRHAAHSKASSLTLFKGEITIMGDKRIPYSLLKRVMATCADSEYPRISLAVLQRAAKTAEGQPL